MLRDGDSVRFGLCAINHCHPREYMSKAPARGLNHSYIFHSFAIRDPPSLSPTDQNIRNHLRELDRTKASIIQERSCLKDQLREIGSQRNRLYVSIYVHVCASPADLDHKYSLRAGYTTHKGC